MILEGFAGGVFGYPADYLLWWGLYLSLLVHTWCFFRLFPRKKYPISGLMLGNMLIFLSMLGGAGIIAESYLRFISVETDSFGVSLPARRWFALHTRLNSLGFRDEEWSQEKSAGVRRIAFVGDSMTYGWGIDRVKDRFTDRLQVMFDQRSPGKIEVMNVSKPGWDTGSEFKPIQKLIEHYDVDEIVLCYVSNDIEGLIPVTDDFNPTRPPDWWLLNLDSSCLLDYLYRRIYLPRVPTVRGYHDWLAEGHADTDIRLQHQQQLGAIARHCKDQGVLYRVVLLPYIRTSGEKFQPERLHDTLRQFFEANRIPVVDLLPVISQIPPNELVVNTNDAHPNEKAHALFVEAIWDAFYASFAP